MVVRVIKTAVGGIIGLALIAFALLLFFGPGEITIFGIILGIIVGGGGSGILYALYRHWKQQPIDAKSEQEERQIRQWFRTPSVRIRLALTAAGGLALLIASLTVPQSSEQTINIYERGLEAGPDSYFHHIYDPKQLLGQLGHIDLELDNFQRATGNIILFAAFEETPSADPWFTFKIAEKWAPGKKHEDRAIVVFVFTKERRVRAEIGYGYEEDLTDIRMSHIVEEKMIPLLREGKTEEAVEAVARELQQSLSHLKGTGQRRTFFDELPVYLREIRRRAGLAVRIWLFVPLTPRLIMSGLALVLWMWVTSLAAGVVGGLITFSGRLKKARQGRNAQEWFGALISLVSPLMNVVFAVVLVFVVLTAGEYFYAGKGLFGGGGVTLFW